ncbi:MAG: nucleoside-triphosphatase [Candidatus Heimdallarchaeaceae archaeon]
MQNILITGPPGIGKTTLIEHILRELNKVGLDTIGFITREVRKGNKRTGFTIELIKNSQLSNVKYILATKTGPKTPYRVGSYYVQLQNLERVIAYLSNQQDTEDAELVIIDEIGKMELLSNKFQSYVIKMLDCQKLIATITLKDNEFTKRIKSRKDVVLFTLYDRTQFQSIKEATLTTILKNYS